MSANKQPEIQMVSSREPDKTATNVPQATRGLRIEPSRILLIRLGGFGDVIFTIPAVHLIRANFPKAKITFLVYKEFAPLLQGFAGIDAVLTLNRARYRSFNPLTILWDTSSLLGRLVRSRFDLVVDFQGFGETALLSWLTRASERWGGVYRPGRKWAYTRAVARDLELHPIDYHLDLLCQAAGLAPASICNEFVPPEADREAARRIFTENSLSVGRPTLFIQPFTSSPHKSWPLEHFISTAKLWRERGVQVLFGGGPGEQEALAPVRNAGFAVAAGAPPLVSAGLVELSTLVLGGDTGLLHLAVAMGRRVVMIMRSVQPGACIPFGRREWTIVPPTPGAHVEAVPFDTVNRACAEALTELGVSIPRATTDEHR